jgi:flagellar hook protein FlgE
VSLGWAGESRLGSILNSSLENSNVDLATEFVSMIITQKGFDANSKVITTGDQVVQTAIQMKR